jgi:hypothetical protein
MLISVISNVKVRTNANKAPQIPAEQPPLPPIHVVNARAYLDFMVFLIHQVLKRRLKKKICRDLATPNNA